MREPKNETGYTGKYDWLYNNFELFEPLVDELEGLSEWGTRFASVLRMRAAVAAGGANLDYAAIGERLSPAAKQDRVREMEQQAVGYLKDLAEGNELLWDGTAGVKQGYRYDREDIASRFFQALEREHGIDRALFEELIARWEAEAGEEDMFLIWVLKQRAAGETLKDIVQDERVTLGLSRLSAHDQKAKKKLRNLAMRWGRL